MHCASRGAENAYSVIAWWLNDTGVHSPECIVSVFSASEKVACIIYRRTTSSDTMRNDQSPLRSLQTFSMRLASCNIDWSVCSIRKRAHTHTLQEHNMQRRWWRCISLARSPWKIMNCTYICCQAQPSFIREGKEF